MVCVTSPRKAAGGVGSVWRAAEAMELVFGHELTGIRAWPLRSTACGDAEIVSRDCQNGWEQGGHSFLCHSFLFHSGELAMDWHNKLHLEYVLANCIWIYTCTISFESLL